MLKCTKIYFGSFVFLFLFQSISFSQQVEKRISFGEVLTIQYFVDVDGRTLAKISDFSHEQGGNPEGIISVIGKIERVSRDGRVTLCSHCPECMCKQVKWNGPDQVYIIDK